jgi:hypothetical protein
VTPSNEQKSLHLIPVRFKASEKLGKIAEKIEIETDLETGAVGSCTATATVLSSRQTSDADKRSTPE